MKITIIQAGVKTVKDIDLPKEDELIVRGEIEHIKKVACNCTTRRTEKDVFVPANTKGAHVRKKHWNCGMCGGLVQIG